MAEALKNLFAQAHLERMARALGESFPGFDRGRWLGLGSALEPLEMKSRVRFLREELRAQLPRDYAKALRILLRASRCEALQGLDLWPISDYIQTPHGLEEPALSLDALRELTPRFAPIIRGCMSSRSRSTAE